MICDASTWAARTHCEIQIPTAWSDNAASVTVHQGSFASGTHAYLYVVDSTNTPNANGFPVTFGGSVSGGVPAQVTGLAATPSTGQVALSWTAASGATSYNVERSTSSSGPFTSIAMPSGTSYTDTGVTAGSTYYYEVAGVNSAGTGPASSVVSATVPTQINSPSFTLSFNPTSVTLNSGESKSITVAVTPQNGFNQQVSFTCSELPLAATCSFSPSTVTPSGSAATTTLTIATNVAMNPLHAPSPFGSHGSINSKTLLALVLFGFGGLFRSRRRWKSFVCAFAMLAGLGLAISGCTAKIGGGSSGSGGDTTPTGTSTITVTATAGTLSQSGTFTLNVQ
jgi:fibronectin type 3 domain-containing protein